MIDIILNDTGAVMIAGDDLVVGVSDQQNQERLLMTEKGDIKQYPEAGVGTLSYLQSEDPGGLLREISVQFSADGMTVKQVKFDSNGKILINAPYEG